MRKIKDQIPSDKGVYVVFLRCDKRMDIRVGSLGIISVQEGIYAYVGSAFGGGGLKSRLSRHLKTAKKCRWHIDYIRRHMKAVSLWYTTESAEAEHRIAQTFMEMGAGIPMKGFGSSDCKCITHLFHLESVPECFLPWEINII